MAKIESGHAEWHNSDIDLRALLSQAVQTTVPLLRERGAHIELQLPDTLPTLRADADRLMQVLLNLLSNAAKFVPQGSGRIVLQLTADAAGVTVSVRDNGPGVPADLIEHLFDPFVTTKTNGSGLGLALVAKIIRDHGGVVECESQPRKTVFRILMPAYAGKDEKQRFGF